MTVTEMQKETPDQVLIAREAWAAALDVVKARGGDQYTPLTCAVMLVVDYARTYNIPLHGILQAFVTNALANYADDMRAAGAVEPAATTGDGRSEGEPS
jgi:thymidine phosphorylase